MHVCSALHFRVSLWTECSDTCAELGNEEQDCRNTEGAGMSNGWPVVTDMLTLPMEEACPGLDSSGKTNGVHSLVPTWPKAVSVLPSILFFELLLCVTLPGDSPAKIHY